MRWTAHDTFYLLLALVLLTWLSLVAYFAIKTSIAATQAEQAKPQQVEIIHHESGLCFALARRSDEGIAMVQVACPLIEVKP